MRFFSHFVSALLPIFISSLFNFLTIDVARADAFVCVTEQGKKVFSNESCEKRKLKVASREFPVIAGQAVSAVVVTMPEPGIKYDANGGMISKDGKTVTLPGQILLSSDMPLEKPVLYFLMATLFGTICILIAFFLHYYRTRKAKMDLFRG